MNETDPTTGAVRAPKVIKRVVLNGTNGEHFRLIARADPDGVRVHAEEVPGSLEPALRTLLDERTQGPIPNGAIQEAWQTLLESFRSAGWTANEEFEFTLELSESDALVVSRLTSPDTPSDAIKDLYKSLHDRMAAMLPNAARTLAVEIVRLTTAGQHAEAFAALKQAEHASTFVGPPIRELVDALCTIDRAVLPRADAFALWGRRVNEKSRGRFYDDLEEDLQVLERDYAEELSRHDGFPKVHLLIRAQIAEHQNKPELAHARYRELVARGPLDARLRADAYWGLFRLSEADDANAVRNAEVAGDAFLEAGDSIQAVHCYASGADLCELHDRKKALTLLNKAWDALGDGGTRVDEYRARILYSRAVIREDWHSFPEALADALESARIRKTISGVEDARMCSLQLAKRIAETMGKTEDVARLDVELEELRPRFGSGARLRERLAKAMSEGVDVQRQLHQEVLQQGDPKLTAESLLAMGIATMKTSLPDTLENLEAALAIAESTVRLRRDLGLRALVESSIGDAHLAHGDEARAISWFARAVTHDPREATARQNLAALLQKHKRFVELADMMEAQVKVYGELPGLLCAQGQALLHSGRPQAAMRALLRARDVCKNSQMMETIDGLLRKASAEPPELDGTCGPPSSNPTVTREEFTAILQKFAEFVKNEHRMSFWRMEAGERKFVSHPEKHGKGLLHAFLRGKLDDNVMILEELVAGAGILDLWVDVPGGMRVVIELKMCGLSYSAGYAAEGIEQLEHYMESKKTHVGHLIVFDARRLHFGQGLEPIVKRGAHLIDVTFVDIRPDVTGELEASRREGK